MKITVPKSLLDKRKGYRLTEEAHDLVSWTEDNRCYCSACSMPPCLHCERGLPIDIAYECDECWEIDPDYEEEEMTEKYLFKKGDTVERTGGTVLLIQHGKHYEVARDQDDKWVYVINDDGMADNWDAEKFKLIKKASEKVQAPPPPKSPWFGYKYQVTPETSKLLQEAVFKGGGKWTTGTHHREGSTHIFVSDIGVMSEIDDGDDEYFRQHRYPEKLPPTPCQFKVGDKVRVLHSDYSRYKIGDVIEVESVNYSSMKLKDPLNEIFGYTFMNNEVELVVDKEDKKEDNGCTVETSSHTYDPTQLKVFINGHEIGEIAKFINKQEEYHRDNTQHHPRQVQLRKSSIAHLYKFLIRFLLSWKSISHNPHHHRNHNV